MAQKFNQLLEKGMPHQHLDSVLAECREQHIKAAKGTKAANAMAKQQCSVGEDEEAIAIASLAVAREARAIAAGSAVASEATEVAAGSATARDAKEVAAGSAVAREAEQYVCLVRRCRH